MGVYGQSLLCGYAAAASWLTMVWDGVITLDREVQFIWPMPWTAHVKWLYLFGKYFAFALQTSVFAVQVFYFSSHDATLFHCRVYRFIEMAANTLLMLCFDIVLLLRIYALYGIRAWSSAFGTFAVVLELATTLASAVATIPVASYDTTCVMIEVPKTILVFVIGTFIAQAILLWLAFRRRERARLAWSSVACVTIRDGFIVFASMSVFLVIIFISTIHDSPATTLLIFFVPMVTCIATCRIILNIQDSFCVATQQFSTDIYGVYGNADSFLLSDAPFQRRGPFYE